jgi:hypothetical protein
MKRREKHSTAFIGPRGILIFMEKSQLDIKFTFLKCQPAFFYQQNAMEVLMRFEIS